MGRKKREKRILQKIEDLDTSWLQEFQGVEFHAIALFDGVDDDGSAFPERRSARGIVLNDVAIGEEAVRTLLTLVLKKNSAIQTHVLTESVVRTITDWLMQIGRDGYLPDTAAAVKLESYDSLHQATLAAERHAEQCDERLHQAQLDLANERAGRSALNGQLAECEDEVLQYRVASAHLDEMLSRMRAMNDTLAHQLNEALRERNAERSELRIAREALAEEQRYRTRLIERLRAAGLEFSTEA